MTQQNDEGPMKSKTDENVEKSMQSRRDFLKTGFAVTGGAALLGAGPAAAELFPLLEIKPRNRDRLLVRKNVKDLSSRERREFVRGVLRLKRTQSPIDPQLNYYDQFVRFHQLAILRARLELGHGIAHQNPAFPPWHRKLVLLFENAVQDVTHNPHFAVPYWDWADPSSLPFVFNDEWMGPEIGDPDQNYAITQGPFRKGEFDINLTASSIWNLPDPDDPTAPVDPLSMCPFPFLTRGLKREATDPSIPLVLPTQEQVEMMLGVEVYDTPPYDTTADINQSFRNYLNGAADPASTNPIQQVDRLHNLVHAWTGGTWTNTAYNASFIASRVTTFVGTLTALDCSPNDPCFWIHHCNVDRLWASWQRKFPNSPFVPVSGANQGWNLNDELFPYTLYKRSPVVRRQGITNASMLDFERLGYTYDEFAS